MRRLCHEHMDRCYCMRGGPGTPPEIRRGRGMRLPTEPVVVTDGAHDAAQPGTYKNRTIA